MIIDYRDRDGHGMRMVVCLDRRPIILGLQDAMCDIKASYARVEFTRIVVSPQELWKLRRESPDLIRVWASHDVPESIMGIPVVAEEDRREWFNSFDTELGSDEWWERHAIWNRPENRELLANAFAQGIAAAMAERDEVYRKHGGTKRPPSKLNPLVQLDEAIGRDLEMGDQEQ